MPPAAGALQPVYAHRAAAVVHVVDHGARHLPAPSFVTRRGSGAGGARYRPGDKAVAPPCSALERPGNGRVKHAEGAVVL